MMASRTKEGAIAARHRLVSYWRGGRVGRGGERVGGLDDEETQDEQATALLELGFRELWACATKRRGWKIKTRCPRSGSQTSGQN